MAGLRATLPLGRCVGAWLCGACVLFVTRTGHTAPPEVLPDPAKATAQRNTIGLGFDPSLARGADARRPSWQHRASEMGLRAQAEGGFGYVDPLFRFTAQIAADGSVLFADPWRRASAKNPERGVCCGRPPRMSFPNFHMSGPVEWLMRISDQDPLRREKAEFLEKTRVIRQQQAIEFSRNNIARALASLESELSAIWARREFSEQARRQLLFARWDECDERLNVMPVGMPSELASQIDRERVKAASRARRQIEAFIRRAAPREGESAFAASELKTLNLSRMSAEPFDPYRPPSPTATATQAKP